MIKRGRKKTKVKTKYLYLLVLAWIVFGILFIYVGYLSLDIALYTVSPSYPTSEEANWAKPMLFFGTCLATTTLLVFGCIFFIFSYETCKGKSWVWNAGVIISTIFLVIFGFMLASLMVTTLLFTSAFTVRTLIIITIIFLVDLGVIFLITRPQIKSYFEI